MPDAGAQIGALIEARAASIRTKNADAVMAQIAPDVLSFDVLVPLANRGAEAVRGRLVRWFQSYEGPIGCELRDLVIRADGDVAFSHALIRFSGSLTSGAKVDMWVRSTMAWERRNARWLIVHEHTSDPMDAETWKTRIDLAP
jgi:ketosteroid isomerase-like protein